MNLLLFWVWVSIFTCVVSTIDAAAQTGKPPWENDIVLYLSTNGTVFQAPRTLVPRAGVSTIIKDQNGRLVAAVQWFPENKPESFDRIAVVFSNDNGNTWTLPQTVQFINLPSNVRRQFDPTLVLLSDGRLRMYFTGNPNTTQPETLKLGIYSAVSTDGVTYTYEPGVRFGVENANVIDCAAVFVNGQWHLYSPVQEKIGHAYHATSADGLTFTRQADIQADSSYNWLGCAVPVEGGVKFFGTGGPGGRVDGVWSAFSTDGFVWEKGTSIGVMAADPGAVYLSNGGLIITATGKLSQTSIRNSYLH